MGQFLHGRNHYHGIYAPRSILATREQVSPQNHEHNGCFVIRILILIIVLIAVTCAHRAQRITPVIVERAFVCSKRTGLVIILFQRHYRATIMMDCNPKLSRIIEPELDNDTFVCLLLCTVAECITKAIPVRTNFAMDAGRICGYGFVLTFSTQSIRIALRRLPNVVLFSLNGYASYIDALPERQKFINGYHEERSSPVQENASYRKRLWALHCSHLGQVHQVAFGPLVYGDGVGTVATSGSIKPYFTRGPGRFIVTGLGRCPKMRLDHLSTATAWVQSGEIDVNLFGLQAFEMQTWFQHATRKPESTCNDITYSSQW